MGQNRPKLDKNIRVCFVPLKFTTRGFLGSLITNPELKIADSKWRIQYCGPKFKIQSDLLKILYPQVFGIADYECHHSIQNNLLFPALGVTQDQRRGRGGNLTLFLFLVFFVFRFYLNFLYFLFFLLFCWFLFLKIFGLFEFFYKKNFLPFSFI